MKVRNRLGRLLSAAVAVVAFATLALPGGALAAKPTVFSDSGQFDADICGVSVSISFSSQDRVHYQESVLPSTGAGSDELWYGIVNSKFTVTYTSYVNGNVLTYDAVRNSNDLAIAYIGEGVWQFTFTNSGLAVKLRDGTTTLLQDNGRLVLRDTVYLGDTSTDTDNYFIGEELLSIAGPHPVYFPDNFCNAFVPAMTA